MDLLKKLTIFMLSFTVMFSSGISTVHAEEGEEVTETPAEEVVTEEVVEEETEEPVVIEENLEKIWFDAEDFETPAVGSDGVVYEGVHYLSVGAVSRLDEEGQVLYRNIVNDIAEHIVSGEKMEDVVVAVSGDGELMYGYTLKGNEIAKYGPSNVLREGEAEEHEEVIVEEPETEEPEAVEATEPEEPEEEVVPEEEPKITEEPAEEPEVVETAEPEETEELVEEVTELEETVEEPTEEPEPAEEITDAAEEEEETYEIVEENMDLYEMFSIPEEDVMDIETEEFDTVLQNMNYFYDQLDSDQKSLYKKAKSSLVSKGKNSFSFSCSYSQYNYSYRIDDAVRAFNAVVATYPNKFEWYDRAAGGRIYWSGYYYGSGTAKITLYKSKYYSKTLYNQAKAKVTEIVDQAYNYAKNSYANNPGYGIVRYFDEWLCNHNEYDHDAADGYVSESSSRYYYAHTAFGTLLTGMGVCESYALAMNWLLEKAGIRSMYAVGDVTGGGHAWNYVQMSDGKWYLQDSTWNDNGSASSRDYLLVNTKKDGSGRTPTGAQLGAGSYYSLSFTTGNNFSTANYTSTNSDPYFSQVTLNETTKYLKPKKTFTLKKVLPENVSGVGSYYSKWPVTWASSNPAVAKVSSKGKITAVKPGSAVITMTIGGVQKKCTVYVYKFSKLTFNENEKTSLSKTYAKSSNVTVTDNVISANFTTSDDQYIYLTVKQSGEKTRTAQQIQTGVGLSEVTAKSSSTASVEVVSATLSGDTITLRLRPKKIGKATITVKFGGKSAKVTLSTKYAIKDEWLDLSAISNQTYTGKAFKPKVLKSVGAPSNLKLKVTYKNNVNAGTATVTIKGGDKYNTVTKTFTISPAALGTAGAQITSCKPGKNYKVSTTVKIGKKVLKAGKDYDILYNGSTTVPTGPGTYKIKVRGKGNYKGELTYPNPITVKK
ncbi:MAG: Ig-like domain-containing protein [Solobacterium sp.]|nr:Ig-like domain-containing protein [Solobacterium sp.]